MTTSLSNTHVRFFTKCGKPLSGGQVYTYEVGTTTPKTTYADARKETVNTNPVLLDVAGSASIFLEGAYRVRVLDRCGVLIEDISFTESWVSDSQGKEIIKLIDKKASISDLQLVKDDVEQEKERAESAEGLLSLKIDQTKNELSLSVASETSRATTAEQVLQDQIGTLGTGNRAYLTYTAMNADKSTIPAKSKVTVTNDPDPLKNGDYQWDGTTFTKSSYDPLNLAKIDATTKANAAEDNAKTYTKGYVQIPKGVSSILINKSVSLAVPKFGVQLSAPFTGSDAQIATYVLANPASIDTTIRRFSVASSIATGDLELRVYTGSSNTFTVKKIVANLKIKKIGLNEFDTYDFTEFNVLAGEYVAVIVKNQGAMVYSGTSPDAVFYSTPSITSDPFTQNTPGKNILKCSFYTENGVERAQVFVDRIEKITNKSEVNFENILTEYSSRIGLVAEPSAKSGINNGIAHMCIGKPVFGFGTVSTIDVYSAVAGPAQVGIYSKSDQLFTRKRFKDITLSIGLNTIPVDLLVSNGEYVGLRTTIVGQIEYELNPNGHDGMFISTSGANPDQFTSSTASPVLTYAYQMRYQLTLKSLSEDIDIKKWLDLKYVSFGDSITWYNGRAFNSSHVESGQIAKGYQSYIVDALGCNLDNKGESGWTLPTIYSDRILPLNFTDVYATTITSGANDHKNSIAVGDVQPIGSVFNTSTYAGALQASIEHIITSNPNTKIFLITPIKGWYSQATADAITGEMHGVRMLSVRYANVMKEIGSLYSLHVIDWYNEVGFNDLNKYNFLGDNPALDPPYLLHPQNKGFQRMGELLLSVLRNY